jgi:predicted HTH transcriptional regulator
VSDYIPFVSYYLGVLRKAYNEFEERAAFLSRKGLSKPDRVKAVIDRKLGKITKREIMDACPGISRVTIERTLTMLVKNGWLVKIGGGRSVAYGKIDKQD